MEFLRKVGLVLATILLLATTTTLVVSLFVVRTVGDEAALKTQLKESGLYDAAARNITSRMTIETAALPNEQTIVNQAVESSLNGITIKKASESFITSTFDWLQGDVATPTFRLDTADIKLAFTDNLIILLRDRLAALPACPPNVIPSSTDPFSATCWPPSMSIEDQLTSLRNEIEADDNLFEAKSITAADITIPTNNGVQPYYVALKQLPQYYRWLTFTPLVAGGLMLVLFATMFALGRPHEKGLKIAAITVLPVGVLLVIVGSFVPQFSLLIARFATNSITDQALQEPVQTLVTNVIRSAGSLLATKGAMLITLSGLLVVAYVLQSRNRRKKIKTGQLSTLV